VLSQLADGELPAAEAGFVSAHLGECPSCGDRLNRLGRVLATVSEQARAASAGAGRGGRNAACPSPDAVAGWRDLALPQPDRTAIARHLETCDTCLGEVLGATRLLARLDATPSLPVPAALRARVAAMWADAAAEESALSRLVVRVTRAGAELVESHLLSPLRELVAVPVAAPAMRSGAAASSALSFELHAAEATITTTIAPAGDSVGLSVRIVDEDGEPLAEQRVYLRRHGRSLYSARTDADGRLRMPGVERGVYEVACPGIGTSFRLDLRE
jgi:hypothetical protein